MSESKTNPYAVTAATIADDVDDDPVDVASLDEYNVRLVSSAGMVLHVIGATALAGAIFGAGVVMVSGGITLISSSFIGEQMGFLLTTLPFAVVVGGVLATLAAIPVSLLMLVLTIPARAPSARWRPSIMRWMYWGTGFGSGWLSLATVMGFRRDSLWMALVPAVVGAVISGWGGERKIRRSRKLQLKINESRQRPSTVSENASVTVPLGDQQ